MLKKLSIALASFALAVPLALGAEVTDTLTRDTTGVTGTSYSDWSGKTGASGAVYAGQSAGGNESIQLRSKNSNSGIITTSSGGTAKKVTVVWNSNTTTGNKLNIYGKDSAYGAASDLYGANAGTSLGSIVMGTSTELTITDDYEYIGMRSDNGALYLTSVSIVWDDGSAPPSSEPSVTLAASATEVEIGEEVTITATAENFSGEVEWVWAGDGTDAGNVFTVDTSVAGEHLIMVEATYGEESAEAEVTITVLAPPPPSVTLEASATVAEIGDVVTVTATAANFSGEVTWEWAGDGTAVGNVFTMDTSVMGEHLIMVEATCGDESADAEVTITVKEPGVEEDYALVSSLDELSDGTAVILTDADSTYALSATITNSVFGATPVTPVNDVISTDDASIVWTLVSDGNGNFSLYNADAGKYAGHGGSSNSGQLQDDAFPHTITLSEGEFVFAATTPDSGTSTYRDLQYNYNNGKPRFAYYKGTQKNLQVYAKSTLPVVEPSVTLAASATEVDIGEEVTITATAENFSGEVEWTWAGDGTDAGNVFTVDTSVAGDHLIMVEATYGEESAEAEVTITVKAPPTAHEIVVDPGENGDAYADVDTAFEGDTVTLTVEPDDGYTLDTLTATEFTSGAAVAVDPDTLTFVMPDDDVYVTVTFKEIPEAVEFVRVTSFEHNMMRPGEYVITGAGTGGEFAMMASIGGTSTKYIDRRASAVSIVNGVVTDADETIIWTLEKNDDGQWTIFNSAVGYAGYVAGGNSAGFEDAASDNSRWIITESETTEGLFTLTNVGTDSRMLLYNGSAPRFACYEGLGNQKELAFYRKVVPSQRVEFDVNEDGPTCEVDWLEFDIGSTYTNFVPARWGQEHTFAGWYDNPDADAGTRVMMGMEVTDEPLLQLYARWVGPRQTITFDPNGGMCSKLVGHCFLDANYQGFKIPVRDDLRFLGWYDSLEGGERIRMGTPVTQEYERTLYAHWGQTVHFDANGGTSKKTAMTAVVGEVYTELATATFEGHSFLGWYDAQDGGNRVRIGDAVEPVAELTLWARWGGPRQTVHFDANGGTCTKTTGKYFIGETYSGFKVPVREGFKFLGWYDAKEGGKRVKMGMTVTEDPERTLYAHWQDTASSLSITGFARSTRSGAAARDIRAAAEEYMLRFEAVADTVYEILWTPSLDVEWTVMKTWTADADGETAVPVDLPVAAPTGFFRVRIR